MTGPDNRVDGVLVVDKPAGLGSTDVVRAVRRAANQKKVGHTGTLDPSATGVLVVCLGRATRMVRFLQAGPKTYRAEIRVGVSTTTQDAAGEVIARRSAAGITAADLKAVLDGFVGDIEQLPPMASAVKIGGERLYDKARRGEEVERPARRVTIHSVSLERFDPGETAHAVVRVVCSLGTYVRTLAHDVGTRLGCGASLSQLRRLVNGAFTLADAHRLEDIQAAGRAGTLADVVLKMREAARGLPTVTVGVDGARRVVNGGVLDAHGFDQPYAVVLSLGSVEHLLAVYADREGHGRPEAVLARPADLERWR